MKPSLILAALLFPFSLSAHPDPSHSLEQLEEHLAETPDDPELLRRKADLFLSTGHPDLARPVVDRLLVLDSREPENLLLDARVCRAKKDTATRTKAADLVKAHPKFAPGWLFLAQIEDDKGDRQEAISAMRQALDLSAKPSATDVLTCAAWLEKRGDKPEAIAVIDQGLAKLGVLSGLHQKAIELELTLRHYDSALRRVDALTGRFRPSVALSLQRADILESAGRFKDAAASCDSALALLDVMPASRKAGMAWKEQREMVSQRKAKNLVRAEETN
ncbi:tetratricopeptide repeat protein [Luteolibacter arcticus]|uniref:Tetratricopeptide repeat protein n=1 Tax=Luteolibacter arcticus TaxID=1581411 RepID=A0ABT3GCX0_9BACT|nr:tetratricopeptide repeat protein [Luteolibacter arcticus]MCW1921480.1 tetratricopeptide repeat protein [Luteolibacter arcticus]